MACRPATRSCQLALFVFQVDLVEARSAAPASSGGWPQPGSAEKLNGSDSSASRAAGRSSLARMAAMISSIRTLGP